MTLDPLSNKIAVAVHGACDMTLAKRTNTRSATEEWLEGLGSKFIDVWLLVDGAWVDEQHIDDVETLTTTVAMSLERLGGRYAVWACGERWRLLRSNGPAVGSATAVRDYPNREAAEMVAIHNG